MTTLESTPDRNSWRGRLVTAALVLGTAAVLVLVGALTAAIDAQAPRTRVGARPVVFDLTDRIRIWAGGISGTPTLLALLAAVAATVASPRPGPDRPPATAIALGLAGGCGALFTLILLYDLAVGPSDAGRTIAHALSRIASIAMGGAAAWWSLLALRPDEPARAGPPPMRGAP